MLGLVALVERLELVVDRRPHGRPGERAARRLRDRLDIGHVGDAVQHVVEGVVRAHPLRHQRAPAVTRFVRADLLRQPREPLLAHLELGEVLFGHLLRRDLGDERLELRPDEERLA